MIFVRLEKIRVWIFCEEVFQSGKTILSPDDQVMLVKTFAVKAVKWGLLEKLVFSTFICVMWSTSVRESR